MNDNNAHTPPFHRVPTELWRQIFLITGQFGDIAAASMVCKRWRDVIRGMEPDLCRFGAAETTAVRSPKLLGDMGPTYWSLVFYYRALRRLLSVTSFPVECLPPDTIVLPFGQYKQYQFLCFSAHYHDRPNPGVFYEHINEKYTRVIYVDGTVVRMPKGAIGLQAYGKGIVLKTPYMHYQFEAEYGGADEDTLVVDNDLRYVTLLGRSLFNDVTVRRVAREDNFGFGLSVVSKDRESECLTLVNHQYVCNIPLRENAKRCIFIRDLTDWDDEGIPFFRRATLVSPHVVPPYGRLFMTPTHLIQIDYQNHIPTLNILCLETLRWQLRVLVFPYVYDDYEWRLIHANLDYWVFHTRKNRLLVYDIRNCCCKCFTADAEDGHWMVDLDSGRAAQVVTTGFDNKIVDR